MKTSKLPKVPQGAKDYKMGPSNDEGGKFQDRNLAAINPLKQQFEPLDGEFIPQRVKMAGGS